MDSSLVSHRGTVESSVGPTITGELAGVLTRTVADARVESRDISVETPSIPTSIPTSVLGAISAPETQHGNAELVQGSMLPRVPSSLTPSPARSKKRGATQSPPPPRDRSRESPPRRQLPASPIRSSLNEAAPLPTFSRPQPPWAPMQSATPHSALD